MNILTFDVEDWYNCDVISGDFNWDKYEVRIYQGIDRILQELETRNQKATFFCLGWIAENHPKVIRSIHKQGHHIGCHSYQHELSTRLNSDLFKKDTLKAKNLIEDIIGEEVNAFRAPCFSITRNNLWALRILSEIGFKYDCSIFPTTRDFGGMPSYCEGIPKRIDLGDDLIIKEFPLNTQYVLGKNIVFSGGGYFRLFPYQLINYWGKRSDYMMTYFHHRDFDTGQPVIKSLPLMKRFKNYVGIKGAFSKFQKLLDNFEFYNIEQADKIINWETVSTICINELQ
jgi:polysaccharide deacetylase family protein (PEP-CTERM system associated)